MTHWVGSLVEAMRTGASCGRSDRRYHHHRRRDRGNSQNRRRETNRPDRRRFSPFPSGGLPARGCISYHKDTLLLVYPLWFGS